MRYEDMPDEELKEIASRRNKSGPTKGQPTQEAYRALYILKERDNMFAHVTFWDGNDHCIES